CCWQAGEREVGGRSSRGALKKLQQRKDLFDRVEGAFLASRRHRPDLPVGGKASESGTPTGCAEACGSNPVATRTITEELAEVIQAREGFPALSQSDAATIGA